ncbi:MAG: T9SS type A sorting domain-containing protein [Bacteroidales bacterium]|nr:T9SS type A sorting domain-containing protein [Bacteroidales bacterium]
MRKFTILLSLVLLATFGFAQLNVNSKIVAHKGEKTKKQISLQKEDPVWEVTFEEETPIWTIGMISGEKTWAIGDTTPAFGYTNSNYQGGAAEVPPSWLFMLWRYVHDFSPSGQNFAWISGIEGLLGVGTLGVEISESYIQFDNIDLTESSNPKLSFYQNYKVYNYDECYVDFSADGGTTWESVRVNEKLSLGGVNKAGEDYLEIIATDYIANVANASIRFRWVCPNEDPAYGSGYGWQLDDIQITETPLYDTKLAHGRMSFFDYVDYTLPEYAEYNVYQISGYYGNIPQAQFASAYANCWFNVAAQNVGVNDVTPVATVEIFDPEMTSIFTNTVTGSVISTNETDTIDLIETEFALGADPMLGTYTVVYTIALDGAEDLVATNNADTAYFNITQDYYGRDVDEPTSMHSLNNSSLGGFDGEQFGQTYMFLWDAQITSIDVFIDDNTNDGTSFIINALQYDSESSQWVPVSSSALNNINAEDLGTWKNVEFTDDVNIVIDPEVGGLELLITIEMYYNGDNEIWIGYDRYSYVDAVHNHGFYTKYDGDETWYYGGLEGGLGLRVNFNDYYYGMSVENEFATNLSIYPNPTTGMLNISGIEGADVQIINMMGQVVESVENLNEYNQIDMSKYANGTYFVKAIVDGNVVTRKINLMK